MQIFFFFGLFITALAVIFAVQNPTPVTVTFLFWDFTGSLALVLIIFLVAGALISVFVSLPANISVRWTVRNQRKKIADLERQLQEAQTKSTASGVKPPQG